MENPDLVLQETGSRPTYSCLNYVPSGDTLRRAAVSSFSLIFLKPINVLHTLIERYFFRSFARFCFIKIKKWMKNISLKIELHIFINTWNRTSVGIEIISVSISNHIFALRIDRF